MSESRVLLVLPTLNEEEALTCLIPEIPREFDVLAVDSASTDKTVEVAKKAGYACLNAKYGRGQGSGFRTGMEFFLDGDYTHLLLMDADYSDNPRDLAGVLTKLVDGDCDVVLGIRDFEKQKRILGSTTMLVKKTISFCIRGLTDLRVRDVTTGVWGFRRESVKQISPRLKENCFAWFFEFLYDSWLLGLRIGEVDVDFRRRIGKTKLTLGKRIVLVFQGLKYGLKILKARLPHKTRKRV